MFKNNKQAVLTARVLFVLLGAALYSVGLEIFLVPNNVIDGGVMGVAIIASHLSNLPLGIFTFLLNVPFFVIGYKQIGKSFTLTTLFGVLAVSLGVSLLHPVPSLTHQPLLACVFGGVIVGVGVGLIIRNGGSLDGSEIIAIIMDKKVGFSVGEIVMFFNLFILSSAGFVFGWDRAMYSLIAYFIAFKAIDVVVEGVDESRAVMVISDRYEDISDAIRDRLGRGGTLLNARGGYLKNDATVLYVVVSRLEIAKLKSIVLDFDENALVTIGSVEVAGQKYQKRPIH
ncbi:MAG: YitT family protein [Ethanoligenens sp.]